MRTEEDGIMASSKAYLDYVLKQLSDLEETTYRAMMGEFYIQMTKRYGWTKCALTNFVEA